MALYPIGKKETLEATVNVTILGYPSQGSVENRVAMPNIGWLFQPPNHWCIYIRASYPIKYQEIILLLTFLTPL